MEQDVLKLWEDLDAFKTQLELTRGKPEFTFYDGPPFATGLPHYGHILAGTIKDVVTRYASQTGHYVSRRFGWDCHGLPVEFEIDKKLGITSKEQVMEMGIAAYNDACRGTVTRYCSEWERIVSRLGRWIDFKDDYKTMEPWYMESVWWVFKTIFDKDLIYRGFKVMPYSTGCTTPLSNFEAGLNYKDDVKDPAVVVEFPLVEDPETSLVAWTTTPWTLPSNLATCVNKAHTYVKVADLKRKKNYILGKANLAALYPKYGKKGYKGGEFDILEEVPGSALVGKRYVPLFEYFADRDGLGDAKWTVLEDDYVTEDSGTGIVHQAPAFGEDDYRVCAAAGVILKGGYLPCPVDHNGCFTEDVPDFKGTYVKAADDAICAHLKGTGRLFSKGTITHRYPFCWRSETPLIYRAVPSWFVRVESIKEDLVANNEQTYWVPSFVKEKRFHNWLTDARDWAISRNRYWGTPLPIWISDDGEEIVVVGSIAELEELTGEKVTDLHRQYIDHLKIPSKMGKGELRRVEEVLDCWFESGCMPYAQGHYPFEGKEEFEAHKFPADFIAEGLDQTRGWFYTLMVLSTALFNKPAFKNVIVNGLVLAEDGKKMSKRLKNYPDPVVVVDKHGADALRLYLVNSPVVRAEPLKFRERGVLDVVKDVFLPWYNAFRFFMQSVERLQRDSGVVFNPVTARAAEGVADNDMDAWITASVHGLIKFVREMMGEYKLYAVAPALVDFIGQLTNWYVRLNRKRLKGADGAAACGVALASLYDVLMTLSRLMAPMTPFLTEYFYQHLRRLHPASRDEAAAPDAVGAAKSVHFVDVPEYDASLVDPAMEARVRRMQAVVELGRQARERRTISLKTPVREVIVVVASEAAAAELRALEGYVLDELNALSLTTSTDEARWCSLSAAADNELGKTLRKEFKAVKTGVEAMTEDDIRAFMASGSVTVAGHALDRSQVHVLRSFKGDTTKYEALSTDDGLMTVIVNTVEDEELRAMGAAREVSARVQRLRKTSGLKVGEVVDVYFEVREMTAEDRRKAAEEAARHVPMKASTEPVPTAAGGAGGGAGGGGAGGKKGGKGGKGGKGKGEKKEGGGKAAKGGKGGKAAPAAAAAAAPEEAAPSDAEAAAALVGAIASRANQLEEALGLRLVPDHPAVRPAHALVLGEHEEEVNGAMLRVVLARPVIRFGGDAVLAEAAGGDAARVAGIKAYVGMLEADRLAATLREKGELTLVLDGQAATLVHGRHLFASAVEQLKADAATQAAWRDCGAAALAAAYTSA
uniref:isoleucine--tRNA ligase n=1 Tax=Bicosoecida sp. CB-2014 TaxID=1486930 RepID=A0A7S1CCN3_9STRA